MSDSHYSIHSDQLKITVKRKGAELCSVVNKTGTEFIWQGDSSIWARHAPILFPIVGKLRENTYSYNGKRYSLPQHGFARDLEFDLLSENSDELMFELKESAETKNMYPFSFKLTLIYKLKGNELVCGYEVYNTSAVPLLFSIGGHPGFNLPLSEAEKAENYYLEFDKTELKVSALKEGLISGESQTLLLKNNKLPLSISLFEHDALVFENAQIQRLSLCSSHSERKIVMECKGWPYFGIWSKFNASTPDHLRFICLEPWHGIADEYNNNPSFANKKGVLTLDSGKAFRTEYSLRFF